MPAGTRIDAKDQIDESRLAGAARLLVELAESCQPDLEAYRREIARDQASVNLAYRQYWPDVTLTFNWYEIGSPGLSPIATGEDAFSLGVGMNLPIWRGKLDAAVREARKNMAQSWRQYAATRDAIQAEVESLHAQFQAHHEVLQILATQIIPDAERTLELSIAKYSVGIFEFQQLIANYKALLGYRIDYHQRQALRQQTIASLERAVGTTVTASTLQTSQDVEVVPRAPSEPSPQTGMPARYGRMKE
jgi:outer membrane protein TolC